MKTMKTKGYKKGGAMKTKGYARGGALKMVEKDGKKVPFYAADGKGKMADGGKVKKFSEGKEVEMPKGTGNMPLDDDDAAKAVEVLKKRKKNEKNKNTPFKGALRMSKEQREKLKTDRKLKPGEVRAKGGGMMKTKGYKKGGAMKTKGYSKGGKVGKVRGAGIAKRGVRKCKMR